MSKYVVVIVALLTFSYIQPANAGFLMEFFEKILHQMQDKTDSAEHSEEEIKDKRYKEQDKEKPKKRRDIIPDIFPNHANI